MNCYFIAIPLCFFLSTQGLMLDKYHQIDAIYKYLYHLKETYPYFVDVDSIGDTLARRPILYIKISSGDPNASKIWIDGGIHAREWISPASVLYVIFELVENQNHNHLFMSGIDYYIVPVLNPDGYVFSTTNYTNWRKNRSKNYNRCSGTDLNRNWGYMWSENGSSKFSCNDTYRGRAPFSEPETVAASQFILKNRHNMKGFLTFHSYAQKIIVPYTYKKFVRPPDFDELMEGAKKMIAAVKLSGGPTYEPVEISQLDYTASGSSMDWAKAVAGIKYSYAIELRGEPGSNHSFLLPEKYIIPTGKDALAIVKVLSLLIQKTK